MCSCHIDPNQVLNFVLKRKKEHNVSYHWFLVLILELIVKDDFNMIENLKTTPNDALDFDITGNVHMFTSHATHAHAHNYFQFLFFYSLIFE